MSGIRNDEGYLDPTPYEAMKNIEKERKKNMSNYDIKRGDIFYIYKFPEQVGSEQSAGRPAIIVSNDLCNETSDVVEVVFLTTQPKADLPTHVRITSTNKDSIALCEQINAIDKSRIGDFVAICSEREMEAVDIALAISVGIDFGRKGKDRRIEETRLMPSQIEGVRLGKEFAKIEAERDTYKRMYEEVLHLMIENK